MCFPCAISRINQFSKELCHFSGVFRYQDLGGPSLLFWSILFAGYRILGWFFFHNVYIVLLSSGLYCFWWDNNGDCNLSLLSYNKCFCFPKIAFKIVYLSLVFKNLIINLFGVGFLMFILPGIIEFSGYVVLLFSSVLENICPFFCQVFCLCLLVLQWIYVRSLIVTQATELYAFLFSAFFSLCFHLNSFYCDLFKFINHLFCNI